MFRFPMSTWHHTALEGHGSALAFGAIRKVPPGIVGGPLIGGLTTTTLDGEPAGVLAGGAAVVVGGLGEGDGDGAGGVPPQAVSATSRTQIEIASSLLPRLNAVFFTAILLILYIFQNSRWNYTLVL